MDNTFYKQIRIFDKRLKSLEKHYNKVHGEGIKLDRELDQNLSLKNSIEDRMRKRVEAIDELYSTKIRECKAQYDLFQNMYIAREEEHRSLEDYINNYELEQKQKIDYSKQHDIANIKQVSSLHSLPDKIKVFQEKYNKLKDLNEQISRDLDQFMKILKMSRESVQKAKKYRDAFEKAKNLQEATIERLQRDTNQLNLVIAQYSMNDCINDAIISNVRAKCNFSITNADNDEFTLNTLKKHKQKQSKIIELLTHKQKVNERDNSILTVEKESVKGLMHYYTDVINKANKTQYVDVDF